MRKTSIDRASIERSTSKKKVQKKDLKDKLQRLKDNKDLYKNRKEFKNVFEGWMKQGRSEFAENKSIIEQIHKKDLRERRKHSQAGVQFDRSDALDIDQSDDVSNHTRQFRQT